MKASTDTKVLNLLHEYTVVYPTNPLTFYTVYS